jgi:redox-sensitive bicupin YhaK (pirin superfamily)
MGNGSVLRPGDVQRMSAGTGVMHSEFNHDPDAPVRLLQIWLLPERNGLSPGYEEKTFPAVGRQGQFQLLAAPGGPDGALDIHQDVRIYATVLDDGDAATLELAPGRHAWVQVATGSLTVNGVELAEGDGAAVSEERALELTGTGGAEVLVFDLA